MLRVPALALIGAPICQSSLAGSCTRTTCIWSLGMDGSYAGRARKGRLDADWVVAFFVLARAAPRFTTACGFTGTTLATGITSDGLFAVGLLVVWACSFPGFWCEEKRMDSTAASTLTHSTSAEIPALRILLRRA
jgi:hypothetical protein